MSGYPFSVGKHCTLASAALGVLLVASMANAISPSVASCRLRASDRAWLERSVRGWAATRRIVLQAPPPAALDAVIFDRHCELASKVAMMTGRSTWVAKPILGRAITVGSQRLPVGVVSATIGDHAGARFVMSVPTVWSDGHVPPGPLGLDRLMSAVMMHEATHVYQMNTYGKQVETLQKENHLADEQFNDDAIQARFGRQPEFANSISRETELFFAAASAPDDAQAHRLATAARRLMRTRAARYFVGDQAYQERAEGLWLTMEGSAQWAGYRWLQLPQTSSGAGISEKKAMAGFGKRGSSWTQLLGLAITLCVDRFQPHAWKQHVYGDGRKTLLQLLDDSIGSRAEDRSR